MFMLGGNGGFAVGPILGSLSHGGNGYTLDGLRWSGWPVDCTLSLFLDGLLPNKQGSDKKKASWKIELNPMFTTTAVITLIVVMSLRAMSQQSFSSFTPQFFVDIAGFSKAQASLLSSVMLFVLAFGTLTGGMLADRISGVKSDGDRRCWSRRR